MSRRGSRETKGRGRVSARKRAEERSTGGGSNYLRLPEGVEFYSVENEGPHKLDFFAWEVGKGNPYAEPGELHFELTFWTHRNVGPNQQMVVCPAKTRNQRCPICEDRQRLDAGGEAADDDVKALLPKERQAWLLQENGEDQLKVWDVSYHLFGKQLDARIKDSDEEDNYEFFASDSGGKTLRVGFQEKAFHGNKFYEARSIDFRDREDVPQETLDRLFALEDCLVVMDYEKLKELYYQTGPEAEDEPEKEKPTKGRKRREEPEPAEDDWDDEPKEEPKPKRESRGGGKASKPEPEPEEEDDDDWDDEPEEKPAKPAKPKAGKPKPKKEPEPEEEEADGDSDEGWDDSW